MSATGQPVKLDPIFGTMFGDHAEDCPCDRCTEFQRKCAEGMARLGEVRSALAELEASVRWTRWGEPWAGPREPEPDDEQDGED